MNNGYFLGISTKQVKRRVLLVVTFFLLVLQMVFSSQVQAAQEGDYTYSVTYGKATITGYTGVGGAVTIPDTLGRFPVTSIGDKAFYYKPSLTGIIIPKGVTSIGDKAFYCCSYLTAFTVDIRNLTYASIDGVLFNKTKTNLIAYPVGKGLTTFTIPQGITSIGNEAFMFCSDLTIVNMPATLTSIGDNAFYDCSGLIKISIPSGVTSIGNHAFHSCTGIVSNINIPQGVTNIGDGAFDCCWGVTSFTVSPSSSSYKSIDGVIFNKEGTTLVACPAGLKSVNIPLGVTGIGNSAFGHCKYLASINIPTGVLSIGSYAFSGCWNLASISIPTGVTSFGDGVFINCVRLTRIPQGVTSIGDSAFESCTGLTSAIIPQGVTSIGNNAFDNCESLTTTNIPQGVTSIGDNAFDGCEHLTSIIIPESLTGIGNKAFYGCTGLTSITFNSATTIIYDDANTIPSATKIIGYNPSTAKTYATKYKRKFEVITEQEGDYTYSVTYGKATITGYTGVGGAVTIPDTLGRFPVTSIGDKAFYCCNSLTNISLPQGVISIGIEAFSNCTNLTSISLPQGTTNIGIEAFSCCTALASINIPQGVTSIGNGAFGNCISLSGISVPKGVTNIGDYAFYGCTGLTSITFNSATTIIYDSVDTIPVATKIIGYATSTAKNYAEKYNRMFEAIPITLQSIVITTPAIKLSYTVGSSLDISGLVVTGTYDDGSTKVENITTANVTGFNSSAVAKDQVLTITVGTKTTTYKVEIVAPISVIGVSLNKSTIAIAVGANENLKATIAPTDATNKNVTWNSSDPAIATVDSSGNVVGLSSGSSDITVTSVDGGKTAICTVTVTDPVVNVTGVSLNKIVTTMNIGANEILSATLTPVNATNKTVTWSSSNTAIATVDSNGNVKGIKAGNATIKVTTQDGSKTATCKVTVKSAPIVKVTKVSLNKKTTSINVGANETLIPTVSPTTATNQNVTWKSSSTKIATVDSKGNVKGIKAGKVTITVTTVDGKKTAKCKVTITTIKR